MSPERLLAPLVRRFRRARMTLFQQVVDTTGCALIVDVGGNAYNWQLLPEHPPVVLVNLAPEHFDGGASSAGFHRVVADARALPFRTAAIDVVFCNSVIEHINTAAGQRQLASEVERVGRQYFVQTPNYGFPIEPHFVAPFFHYLPLGWRLRLARNFTFWGWLARPSPVFVDSIVREIRLLGPREFRSFFPGGELVVERFAGLAKSLIAVRTHGKLRHRSS